MIEPEVRERLERLDRKFEKVIAILEGESYSDPGVVGELREIRQALWGPPGRPNGALGILKEVRITTRTIIVGAILSAVGIYLQQGLG